MDATHWALFGGLLLALTGWGWETLAGVRDRRRRDEWRTRAFIAERALEQAEALAADRLKRLKGAANYLEEFLS